MIKYNQATECCIMNGAEAEVVSWISDKDSVTGKQFLKTVFVKLKYPPYDVNIPGLPTNIVPIHTEPKVISCTLPDDSVIKVNQLQPPLIANFAMTDYGSQGRTRPNNVVHLANCRSHQAYYTALSRSSHSTGTVIIGSINTNLITGGISGWLRQEFCDLEILNDITTRNVENNLHSSVTGTTQYTLIKAFCSVYGNSYIPQHVHNALRWSTNEYSVPVNPTNMQWSLIKKKQLSKSAQHCGGASG